MNVQQILQQIKNNNIQMSDIINDRDYSHIEISHYEIYDLKEDYDISKMLNEINKTMPQVIEYIKYAHNHKGCVFLFLDPIIDSITLSQIQKIVGNYGGKVFNADSNCITNCLLLYNNCRNGITPNFLNMFNGYYKCNKGHEYWFQNGLHRKNGPAMIWANGTKHWYQHNKRHRTDGPAIEYTDGIKIWYQNNQLHRTDGPAVEWADSPVEYWINGIELTDNEWKAHCFNKWLNKHLEK